MSTPTNTDRPRAATLYESAIKIYPREIKGRFESLSKLATNVLLGLFYFVPWLLWDDRQAFLFDLPARKFYLLGLTLWPQDFPYLALLLMIAALFVASESLEWGLNIVGFLLVVIIPLFFTPLHKENE